MKHQFDTVGDAIAAGYESPGRAGRVLGQHNDYDVIIVDASGGRSFGYDFAVKALANENAIRAGRHHLGPFGSTVTVWTDDLNGLGKPGSFRAMFAPGVLDSAICEAIQSIAMEGRLHRPLPGGKMSTKQLTRGQWKRVRWLHALKDRESDKAIAAIERHDRIDYLFYRSSARAITRQIDGLLVAWLD